MMCFAGKRKLAFGERDDRRANDRRADAAAVEEDLVNWQRTLSAKSDRVMPAGSPSA